MQTNMQHASTQNAFYNRKYSKYTCILIWWPVFQDNTGKPVPEWQTILGFTAARDDGHGNGANQN